MYNIGQFSLWLGLVAVGISSICYLLLHANNDNRTARSVARFSFIGFATFITLSSMLLMHFILKHDFVYAYIIQYSSKDLPLIYLISSFWAGQEGSFLLWVLLGAWLGILLMFRARDMEPQVMLIYNLNNLFLMILLIKQSPFQMVAFPPADGNGLNMLLQDPWMAIHPPIVFLGYAAYAIPFAYAIAALWRREYELWITPGLPWAIFAFVTLGAGIIIGGFWSYKVLGWGGYWGWDPVENASLLPWLAGTALVHGMILQQTRKKLAKTNFFLAAFSFILVIYCTFLTRSGVLADFSVHSFVDLGITGWLVLFMGAFIAISLWFFVTRAKEISHGKNASMSFFSREFGLIAAMLLLCFSCIVTGLGTSAPLITRLLEKASKVSTEFYVNTNLPIALIMLLFLSAVPLMTWGHNSLARLVSKLHWALLGGVASLSITLWKGYPGIGVLMLSVLAGAAAGMNLFLLIKLLRKRITLSSGAMIHFGVGLMFIGIVASSAYDRSEKHRLTPGATQKAFGYDLTFKGPEMSSQGKGARLRLPTEVSKGNARWEVTPDIYSEPTKDGSSRRFVHPYIGRGIISDLYISPVSFDPGTEPTGGENHFELKKGEKTQLGEYEITFTGFDLTRMRGQKGSHKTSVGATLLVSHNGKAPVDLKPIIAVGELHSPESRVQLPGPGDAYITLIRINAGTKTVILKHEGTGIEKTGATEGTPFSVVFDVSIKPGMTVLWLGTFLMLLGGCIGIARRRVK